MLDVCRLRRGPVAQHGWSVRLIIERSPVQIRLGPPKTVFRLKDTKVLKVEHNKGALMTKTLVVVGALLILVGIALITYESFNSGPPVLGAVTGQSTGVNYLAFFGFALGGAGILILIFSFVQWFTKPRPK